MDAQWKQRLSTVFWIGGATDAGKTSVARQLSQRLRLPAYHYDLHDLRHHNHLAQRTPAYASFLRQTLDERWVQPEPEALAERAWRTFEDRFPLVLDDLTTFSMPPGLPIIAEGYGLTPRLVAEVLSAQTQLVCLLPTPAFKLDSMARRRKGQFGGEVSDPERAARNLSIRDRMIADRIGEEAKAVGAEVIEVDGALSVDDLATFVGARLGLIAPEDDLRT